MAFIFNKNTLLSFTPSSLLLSFLSLSNPYIFHSSPFSFLYFWVLFLFFHFCIHIPPPLLHLPILLSHIDLYHSCPNIFPPLSVCPRSTIVFCLPLSMLSSSFLLPLSRFFFPSVFFLPLPRFSFYFPITDPFLFPIFPSTPSFQSPLLVLVLSSFLFPPLFLLASLIARHPSLPHSIHLSFSCLLVLYFYFLLSIPVASLTPSPRLFTMSFSILSLSISFFSSPVLSLHPLLPLFSCLFTPFSHQSFSFSFFLSLILPSYPSLPLSIYPVFSPSLFLPLLSFACSPLHLLEKAHITAALLQISAQMRFYFPLLLPVPPFAPSPWLPARVHRGLASSRLSHSARARPALSLSPSPSPCLSCSICVFPLLFLHLSLPLSLYFHLSIAPIFVHRLPSPVYGVFANIAFLSPLLFLDGSALSLGRAVLLPTPSEKSSLQNSLEEPRKPLAQPIPLSMCYKGQLFIIGC